MSLVYSKSIYLLCFYKRFYSASISSLKHLKLIQNLTDSSKEEILECLDCNKEVQTMTEEEITHRLNKLNELQLADDSLKDKLLLLKHHPKTIKHRYLSLKEFGFLPDKINSSVLSKYIKLVKQSTLTLKRRKLIDNDCDIVKNILSYTPLNHKWINEFNITDYTSPYQIKALVMKKILIDVVGYDKNFQDKEVLFGRLKHRSISETLKNLSVLQHQVGLSLEKIRSNPFLLSATNADNTLEIMSLFPSIGSVDIKSILNSHPKIIAAQASNMVKIYKYLTEAGISDSSISKCFEVFTLNCETVKSRLEECLHNNDFFSAYKHHPRILELILYQNKAKARLEKLKENKVNSISLHALSSCDKYFNKFFDMGAKRQSGIDVIYFLSKELNSNKTFVRKQLCRHPYWYFSSLMNVSENLNLLLKKGFTREEILDEACILLYPSKSILEELDKVKERPESQVCKDEQGNICPKKILPLTLYFIEREAHFTGSAMWKPDTPPPSPNLLQQEITSPLAGPGIFPHMRTLLPSTPDSKISSKSKDKMKHNFGDV